MPLIAKYRLTWRGSVVEPGTVIDALNPDEDRRLLELQRARSVVFVPEEEGNRLRDRALHDPAPALCLYD